MSKGAPVQTINFDRLLKLRLVVARVGEMDLARWWNTDGLLGRQGRILMSRGFPKTFRFAQARAVFAVAKARCHELFDPPGCMTLWSLPADIEDQFDARWHRWLEDRDSWEETFGRVEAIDAADLLPVLNTFDLLTSEDAQAVSRLRRSAEGRAVPLPGGTHSLSDSLLTLLAAGFARGEIGKPAIPYAQREQG